MGSVTIWSNPVGLHTIVTIIFLDGTVIRSLSGLQFPRRFTKSLGFVARHLRWVPHALLDAQKGERINLSRRLLRMLEVQGD
jgi:hypothetical protein